MIYFKIAGKNDSNESVVAITLNAKVAGCNDRRGFT